jgi:hypothetical protein
MYWKSTVWTEEKLKKGQAWGLKTIESLNLRPATGREWCLSDAPKRPIVQWPHRCDTRFGCGR